MPEPASAPAPAEAPLTEKAFGETEEPLPDVATSAEAGGSVAGPMKALASMRSSMGSMASPMPSSPAMSPSKVKPFLRMPVHGWVTLSSNGEDRVTKETGVLPGNVRQQYMQQWSRRQGMDSFRERARVMARDEEQITSQRLCKALGVGLSSDRQARRSTSTYLQQLESDPRKIGFAYGGVHPGRLHAKGRLVEKHEVQFSVGVSGHYLLHVRLRRNAATPATPLPGSPFALHVVPGAAHPLSTKIPPEQIPLQGTLEKFTSEQAPRPGESAPHPRCSCTLRLVGRDKMGNKCDTGGAAVSCGSMDSDSPLESSWEDVGNGEYALTWSSPVPGNFMVFVKIDGLHILGSPAPLSLTSGTPDLSQTEVSGAANLKKATAGKASKVRLHCKDAGGHPAVPGPSCIFGVTLVPASIADPEAWRKADAEVIERSVVSDQLEVTFVPKLAVDLKVFIWYVEEPKLPGKQSERRSLNADSFAMAQAAREAASSFALAAAQSTSPMSQRPRKRQVRRESVAADLRKLLPGIPFPMQIVPADLSMKKSYIDGIQLVSNGTWQDVPNVVVGGKPKLKEGDAEASFNHGPSMIDSNFAFDSSLEEVALQVGDVVRFRPFLCDEFENPVGAPSGSLILKVTNANGEEVIPVISQLIRGGTWSHEVQYDLRFKGRHTLDVLLDDVPIPGSPLEWQVKLRL